MGLPFRPTLGRLTAATCALLLASLFAPGVKASTPNSTGVQPELYGQRIAVADVSRYYRHDRAFARIRCFASSIERDADELASVGPLSTTGTAPYLRWFVNANYGGLSFDAYQPYRDLRTVGWNDAISSFEVFSSAHPCWWRDAGYTGLSWNPGTASVSDVGHAANNQFSSMQLL